MDRIQTFLHAIYEQSPTDRILVKHIYEDFKAWIVAKYGVREFAQYEKRQFHKDLKSNGIFIYKRYRDGVCLTGIKYRGSDLQHEINLPQIEEVVQAPIEAIPVRRLRLHIL
jgi:hypothetical protein